MDNVLKIPAKGHQRPITKSHMRHELIYEIAWCFDEIFSRKLPGVKVDGLDLLADSDFWNALTPVINQVLDKHAQGLPEGTPKKIKAEQ